MPEDPAVLFVAQKPTNDRNPVAHPFYYYTDTADHFQRAVLLGYSLFFEVMGLPQADDGLPVDQGLDLLTEQEYADRKYAAKLVDGGGRYSMSFEDYFDYYVDKHRIETRRINFCRLFLIPLGAARVQPFNKVRIGGEEKFDLTQVNSLYLDRLAEFIETARRRGIVVNLSFFSNQMLRGPQEGKPWYLNPFNAKNNHNEVIATAENEDALNYFCVIREGSGDTPEERLYRIQENFVTKIVERTRPYWNVVYEIFNEAATGDDEYAMAEVVPWHGTVAGWLNRLLADGDAGRKRLIGVAASPRLIGPLLDSLGVRGDNRPGLVDFVGLHGAQWGGNPARTITGACANFPEPPTEGIDDPPPNGSPYPSISEALDDYKDRWVALIFDADAHYLAQKFPTVYVEKVLNVYGSFNYRWGPTFLHVVNVSDCAVVDESNPTLGLDQRQGLIYDAPNISRVTELPVPPEGTPTGLAVTVEVENNQPQLHLTFNRAEGEHEGYVVYFGPSASTLGLGAAGFEPHVYLEKSDGPRQDFKVPFNPPTVGPGVHVAVAARNGLVAGGLSNIVSLAGNDAELDLSRTSLPTSIETRRDFRDDQTYRYYVTFKNKGVNRWEGREQITHTDYIATRTLGIYMPVREMASGLALLFIPLLPQNRQGRSEPVLPSQSVTIYLNEMMLTTTFAQYYGEFRPILLPYSRKPLSFEMGMGSVSTYENNPPHTSSLAGSAAYGHFGRTYKYLSAQDPPPPDAPPIKVTVRRPERLATQIQPEQKEIGAVAYTYPLASGQDFNQYLGSVSVLPGTTAQGGMIIRSGIRLQNITKAAGPATRLFYVQLEGGAAGARVPVSISAVRLHPIDLYYAGPHVDPKNRLYEVPGFGGSVASGLERFEGRYTSTAAWSDTVINPDETITFEVRPGYHPGQAKQLIITNHAQVTSAQVAVFTAHVWEDIKTAEDIERQRYGPVEFKTSGPSIAYVDLDDGSEHRYYVAHLRARARATIGYDIVLKEQAGKFRRMLEIRAANYSAPLTVDFQVLEVRVETQPGTVRRAADLPPVHAARILEFFNRAGSPQEIVRKIRDNPAFRRDSPRAYGVRPKLAERILQVRASLPGGRFTSVVQIDDILRVGEDTFEDIAFTFEDNGSPTTPGN